VRVDEVDLHFADTAVQVAHQAAARPQFPHERDQVSRGVKADERQSGTRGVVGVLAEDEHDTDQVREIPKVTNPVSPEQQRRVERPAQPDEPVDDLPPLRGRQEEPDLVEAYDLVPRAVP